VLKQPLFNPFFKPSGNIYPLAYLQILLFMNESLQNLNRFIRDFNLRQPNGVVAFNAKIEFSTNKPTKTKDCEVHIITSDNLATIYFLNQEINTDGLPDMFDAKNTPLIYIVNQCLKIEKDGSTVLIFPLQTLV